MLLISTFHYLWSVASLKQTHSRQGDTHTYRQTIEKKRRQNRQTIEQTNKQTIMQTDLCGKVCSKVCSWESSCSQVLFEILRPFLNIRFIDSEVVPPQIQILISPHNIPFKCFRFRSSPTPNTQPSSQFYVNFTKGLGWLFG